VFRLCLFATTFTLILAALQAAAAPVKVPAGLFKDVNAAFESGSRMAQSTKTN